MEEIDLKKRYWIFKYGQYYPLGGLEDVIITTDDLTIAAVAVERIGVEALSTTVLFDAEKREVLKIM